MDVDAPEPPDYGAATREGIETDIETLPSRLLAERAAAEGRALYRRPDGSFTLDPRGGGTLVSDFTGVGDDTRIERDITNQTRLLEAGAGVARNLERDRLQDMLELLPEYNALNLEQQRAAYDAALDATESGERRRLDLELEMRPRFTESELDAQRQAFGQSLDLSEEGTRRQAALQEELLPRLNRAGLDAQADAYRRGLDLGDEALGRNMAQADQLDAARRERLPAQNDLNLDMQEEAARRGMDLGDEALDRNLEQVNRLLRTQERELPGLNRLGLESQSAAMRAATAAGREANPLAYDTRDTLGRQLLAELEQGDELTPAQRRRVEQNMRASQATRGNILGESAALDEALALSGYGEEIASRRRADALNFINSRDLDPRFESALPADYLRTLAPNQAAPNLRADQFEGSAMDALLPNAAPPALAAQGAINPLMPNMQAGGYTPNMPAFQATTTGGPNTTPMNMQRTGAWNVTNPNAGAAAVGQANTRFQQQMDVATMPNPWLQGLGMVAGAATGGIWG